ncbi:MAG TPA: hypothetical protein VNV16_09795 [Methylibium sp.]|nr:hypothetical protein [Methylibium sp.]
MAIERFPTEGGGMRYVFEPGRQFERPAWPAGAAQTECANWIESAANDYSQYLDEVDIVIQDQRLSSFGKEERLVVKHGGILESVSKLRGAIDHYSAGWDKIERDLYQVPELTNDAGQAAIDIEVRQWWRGMSSTERTQYLQALSQPDNNLGRIRLALLRSPIAVLDHELTVVREAWNAEKRALQPAIAESIDTARQTIATAEVAAAHLGGMAMVSTQWDSDRIASHLLGSTNEFARRGYRVFGIGDEGMARAKRIAEGRRYIKAAA